MGDKGQIRVDVRRMSEYVGRLKEERRLLDELLSHLMRSKSMTSTTGEKHQRAIRHTRQLIEFIGYLIRVTEELCDEAIQVNREITAELEEARDAIKHLKIFDEDELLYWMRGQQ